MFGILDSHEILPMLAGYFFRINLCLMTNRQKETTDAIYSNPQLLFRLIDHSEHMSIASSIQLYLNLDINKHPSVEN